MDRHDKEGSAKGKMDRHDKDQDCTERGLDIRETKRAAANRELWRSIWKQLKCATAALRRGEEEATEEETQEDRNTNKTFE